MSQISQLSKLAVSVTITAAVTLSPPSLPQLPPVPQQPNHVFCHIILWLVGVVPFSTNRNVFFCLQTLPACGHFCDKGPFLLFLPAPDTKQTWRQCSRKSAADIIYCKSGFEPLNHAAAMLKISGQSDPDLQGYLRHTYTDRQRCLAFIERLICVVQISLWPYRVCHTLDLFFCH